MSGTVRVRRRGTQWWLWIGVVGLVVVVLWGLTGGYLARDRRQQLEFAAASARIQVQLLAEHTAALFRQVELGLRVYPANYANTSALPADGAGECSDLRRTVLDLPGVDNAVVLAADGLPVCSLRGDAHDEFPVEELMLRHRDELRGFSITPATDGRDYLTLGIRLDDEDGRFLGVLAATIPRDYFTSRFRDYGTINAELIAIYDEDRNILTRWPASEDTTALVCAEPLLAGLPEDELVSGGLRSVQTEHAVIAIFQLPGFAYRIVIANGLPSLLEGWRSYSVILASVAIVLGLTILAAGSWIRWTTERKRRLAEELAASRAREQQAKIDRLEGLRALAGGLAHDINNRMMVVLGNSEVLELRQLADSRPLRSIREAARQTSALSDRMLSAAGHTSLTASVIDVAEMVAAHEPDMRSMAGERAELVFSVGSSPHLANADEQLLRIAITNLVENALEAIRAANSRIDIAVGEDWIAGTVGRHWSDEIAAGRYVTISVSDNGEGMDRPQGERVFDPFFSARFLGRGLGLSAVAGIARQHGGAVALESELGQGTTVTIYIPSAKETPDHE